LRTFSNFSTARCQACFAGLEDSSEYIIDFFVGENVCSLVIRNNRCVEFRNAYFYKGLDGHAFVLEE